MTDTRQIITAIKREFPKPDIDPAWVQACVKALQDAGETVSVGAVREQYLYSDFNASTRPSNLIPSTSHEQLLFPRPTLLQIVSMTEIGSSAFQLHNVLEQRRDVLDGATRIKRMEDEEQDDLAAEGDDKLPAYPRGMLKLQVSDGQQVVNAMEYKRIADLCLGETSLGAKVLVQNVKSLRNNLLLTPQNTQVIGYSISHLEPEQPRLFLESLLTRMGKPIPDPGAESAQRGQAPVARSQAPPRGNAPLSRHTGSTADRGAARNIRTEEDMARARAARAAALAAAPSTTTAEVTVAEPGRIIRPVPRRIPNSALAVATSASGSRRRAGSPSSRPRHTGARVEPIEIADDESDGSPARSDATPRSGRAASAAASQRVKELYDATFDTIDDDDLALLEEAEANAIAQTRPARARSRRSTSDASTWFEVDEEKTSQNRVASGQQAERIKYDEQEADGCKGNDIVDHGGVVSGDSSDNANIRLAVEQQAIRGQPKLRKKDLERIKAERIKAGAEHLRGIGYFHLADGLERVCGL